MKLGISLLSLFVASASMAQNVQFPIVTVVAADPSASEEGADPGVFVISRLGLTNSAFRVFYTLRGTASNGVDYQTIGESVEFPAGASRVSIPVVPIDDDLLEGVETVNLRLMPSLIMAPIEPYRIGSVSNAVVNIVDNDRIETNRTVVNITATDPVGSEIPEVPPNMERPQLYDPAVFTVTRHGPTNIPITVYYRIGGTAANGEDYTKLPEAVRIPEGARAAQIEVSVIDDLLVEGPESVIIRLEEPACIAIYPPPADCYVVGSAGLAQATIRDDEELIRQAVVSIVAVDAEAAEQDPRLDSLPNNGLLKVTRTGPTDFPMPVYYRVIGTAENGVDYVKLPGTVTIPTGAESADLVIEAIDDLLVEGTESLNITIDPPACIAIYPPPPECYLVGTAGRATAYILDNEEPGGNLPPGVAITRPVNGAVFPAHSNIRIEATTMDRDGYAPYVEFFANSNKIGEAMINFIVAPPDGEPIHFTFDWRDVRPGSYVLTARATDDEGAVGLSSPVRISVTESNIPPQTNRPVVSIVAIDPYASEGLIIWVTNQLGSIDPVSANTWGTNRIGVTNTATFLVRRDGPTNLSLYVPYEVGGTASNGVDYVQLPGGVQIPAGQRSARIEVVPLEDSIPEPIESVIIALRETPIVLAVVPPYIIGSQSKAAATISDNDRPRPPLICLRDGLFHFCRPATNGYCYRLEASTDLKEWTTLCTNRVTEGAIQYVDADAPSRPFRFYRALPADCLPED